MPKRNHADSSIEITEAAFDKIMSWSMALDEVMFLACGKGQLITDAVRLMNMSSAPRNYCYYSRKDFKAAIEHIQLQGLQVICMGHSHPNKLHLRKPSKSDWMYLPRQYLQMIAFPIEYQAGAWKLEKTYSETLKSEISVRKLV